MVEVASSNLVPRSNHLEMPARLNIKARDKRRLRDKAPNGRHDSRRGTQNVLRNTLERCLEWSKGAAWKADGRFYRHAGSNPVLSANYFKSFYSFLETAMQTQFAQAQLYGQRGLQSRKT